MTYSVPKTQLSFIRTGARYAEQQFKYDCKNSNANILFKTQTGKETAPTRVIYDNCQGRNQLESSLLEIKTKGVKELPVRDFAAIDVESSGQEFGFTMGPACFY